MARFSLRKLNIALKLLSLITYLLLATHMTNANENKTATQQDCVIVLHGLARTAFSMRKIETALENDYKVINKTYPSRKHSIKELADIAIAPAIEQCSNKQRIHFVTHSLGGILVRQYLSEHDVRNIGNVVMLGPPNNGSELVDYFQSTKVTNWAFEKANGPAGAQLGTQDDSRPIDLGPVSFSLGVIAGNVSYSPVFSKAFEGDDDGKVSVASTKIDGMKDHIVLPVSHTFMMDQTII